MQLFHVPHYLVTVLNWYKHKKKRKCKIEVVCKIKDIETKKALSHVLHYHLKVVVMVELSGQFSEPQVIWERKLYS